jgi:uncharacterized damage-inducible protein DinB
MSARESDSFRQQLAKSLAWKDAHVDFDAAIDGIPPDKRGARPDGAPHSAWQLLEHLRLAQHDILDFCLNPGYKELVWPDDYWPASPEPPAAAAWDESVRRYRADRDAMARLATDPAVDLDARIPHGQGQTIGREVLLVLDHAAYHLGELVLLRRLLGIWP